MYRSRLLEFGLSEDEVLEMEADVMKRVDEATEIAKSSPPPTEEVMATEVWADGSSTWRN